MKNEKKPVAIVGGGIVGLLSAWYLAEAGLPSVIFDRQTAGKESSWAGGGILSPLYPDRYPSLAQLSAASLSEYPRIADAVAASSGVQPELVFSNLIAVDVEKRGESPAATAAKIERMEPALKLPGKLAACYPSAQIRNPRLLCALRVALSGKGVQFVERSEVVKFLHDGARLKGLVTHQSSVEIADCIVAAGAWTGSLLAASGLSLPIKPISGQMIVIAGPPGLISNIIVHEYRYLIPRVDGRVLVGSTVEDVGFNKKITTTAREKLHSAAVRLVPELRRYPIEHHWAGLRPGSPDDAPFIGEHPGIKGLFVCAGHYRNGFATGPASARLVVDMMLGRPPSVDPTPFRLDRACPEWKISREN